MAADPILCLHVPESTQGVCNDPNSPVGRPAGRCARACMAPGRHGRHAATGTPLIAQGAGGTPPAPSHAFQFFTQAQYRQPGRAGMLGRVSDCNRLALP